MSTETLDRAAARAVDALHAELEGLDTEAALEAVTSGRAVAPEPRAPRRRRGTRIAAVAAAVLVLGGIVAALRPDGSGRDVRVADGPPIDASAYGAVVGRLESQVVPGLVAEVHGPELLGARSEVAVAVRGAAPGRTYHLAQCLRPGLPVNNPATTCAELGDLVIGSDGTGVAALRLPAVFMGTVPLRPNDCRTSECELQIGPLVGEDEPESTGDAAAFVPSSDPFYVGDGSAPSPWLPLAFDPAAEVDPLPTLSVTAIDGPDQGRWVRIEGANLAPGALALTVQGFLQEPAPPFSELSPTAVGELRTVEVGADGSFEVELALPDPIVQAPADIDGEARTPAPVACGAAPWACRIRVLWADGAPSVEGTPALLPEPVAYPAA
ncbi:MAG: hypothetical protein KDB04_05450 [Acidimicrobiales bacterium]|nr:hypothetical protein [Acidimicrobiales bacterium]HRW36226.1 hypothetical protein [Aquihabitans sp.]